MEFAQFAQYLRNLSAVTICFVLTTADKVVTYKKVLMKTATFYFRDKMSITASIFHRETTLVHN